MSRFSMYNHGNHRFLNDPEALNDVSDLKRDVNKLQSTHDSRYQQICNSINQLTSDIKKIYEGQQLLIDSIKTCEACIDSLTEGLEESNKNIQLLSQTINEDRDRIQACHDYCFTDRTGWLEGKKPETHNTAKEI